MTLVQAACLSVFPVLVIIAALTDMVSFTIPNRITVLLALCFAPAALSVGQPLGEIGVNLAVGAAALVAAVAMFAARWIGGGDAKLFAACAFWLGWPAILPFLMWTSLAGGVLALALLWSRKLTATMPALGPPGLGRLMKVGGDVPYGLAIAAGALIAFPSSALFSAPL